MKKLLALATTVVALVAVAPSFAGTGTFITDTLAPGGGTHSPYDPRPARVQGYRFITDTLAPGGGTSQSVTVVTHRRFAWADAGIGAAVTVGSLLILLGSTVVLRSRARLAV
jgi:hypothetical protein